ncbi:NADH:flavin oxidoreductase/NADH oxidase [Sphingobium yanoikuyae]|uniref:NADH:flavin oxidoreductase/NADH oxidase n=1 Tax=Sphingobium yanoikuyae TaxID=13690 RepID=UPI0022DE3CD0|nr:NADH:flavin oxidoreductase/NADH oxidase [Sphingobium yanoikuyae]WBQ15725.1 NADH:flavin oxidoreductase/NADH oxidase [Sphingobium yanoikuyae]
MSALFEPFKLKGITLRNRIAVPPMCQYSAIDGVTNRWHWIHYPSIARGGAGLVIVEATGVSADGRITPGCSGLWHDGQIEGMARIAAEIKAEGAVAGIQIGHAGRKASANLPWEGDDHIPAGDPRGWETISPSAIPFGGGLPRVPREMTLADIERVKADFVVAAKRALAAGFEWLELHFAHGYLAQSFFSVHANQRTDQYGGDWRGRGRFLTETLEEVRKVWPEHLPLTARFGVIEFDGRDEETLVESIALVNEFKVRGLDMLNVSIGFSTIKGKTPWAEGFMAPYAGRLRRETGLPVATAWCIDGPEVANAAVEKGELDLVMIARAHLADPHYPYAAARALGEEKPAWVLPAPYAHWLSRYRGIGKAAAQ